MNIETSTQCSCGGHVELSKTEGWADKAWRARCSRCYDPTEGAGDRATLIGFGPEPADALLAWEEQHDEVIAEEALPEWVGELALQVGYEAERQRDWERRRALHVDGDGIVHSCLTVGPVVAA